jgi:Inovirus Coat protein B
MNKVTHAPLSFRQKMARIAAIPVALFSAGAFATLDAGVTTAMADAKADILALGAIVFGIAVAIMVYKWLKRAL